jgi:hypothetical protein
VLLNRDPSPATKQPWTAELVLQLATKTAIGDRERRILWLFCDSGAPTVPGADLTAKFGCGSPLDGDRDLPAVAAFARAHELAFPLTPSGGSDAEPRYRIAWDAAEQSVFRDNDPDPGD